MSVHSALRSALRDRLVGLFAAPPEGPRIALEGVPFDPPAGEEWIREQFAPNASDLATIGPLGRIRHRGAYFLQCFAVGGKGAARGDALAETLYQGFPPNLQLTAEGFTLTIQRCSRQAGRPDGPWYAVPVTLLWYADTANTL